MRARSECFLVFLCWSVSTPLLKLVKISSLFFFFFFILKVNTVIFIMLLKVVFGKLDSRHNRDAITRTRSVFRQ